MNFIILWFVVGIINAFSLLFIGFKYENREVLTLMDIFLSFFIVVGGIMGAIVHLCFYISKLNKVILYKKKRS
jgi:flagellar motor component MotA